MKNITCAPVTKYHQLLFGVFGSFVTTMGQKERQCKLNIYHVTYTSKFVQFLLHGYNV